jgi:hypothetical protein
MRQVKDFTLSYILMIYIESKEDNYILFFEIFDGLKYIRYAFLAYTVFRELAVIPSSGDGLFHKVYLMYMTLQIFAVLT